MLMHILSSSLLIACVLLLRVLFRGRVPYRLLYLLWIPVFLRLIVPGTVYEFSFLRTETDTAFDTALEWLSTETDGVQNDLSEDDENHTQAMQHSSSISIKEILCAVYAIGCLVIGCRLGLIACSVRRKLRESRRFLRMHGRIRVYCTRFALAPCVHGLIPAIYLAEDTDPKNVSLILEHEMTHIRHFDFVRILLRKIVAVLYWWNPFVWLYIRFAAEDAELACDEAVAKHLNPSARLQYANAIYASLPQNKNGAIGFVGKPLKRRLVVLTKQSKTRAWAAILAVVLLLGASALCACGLSVGYTVQEPGEPAESNDWCKELFPKGFPVPLFDEIYEIVQEGETVTVTLFSESGPVSDYLPSHNLIARLEKIGYVRFYDFETRMDYFMNKDGYNVTIRDSLNAGWLYELNKQNPYGYTYQIKLEKIPHSYESVFWKYPYKKTDLGLSKLVFDDYPTAYLPSRLPDPKEVSGLHLIHAYQDCNGVFLQFEGIWGDYWNYNRAISDAGFYFIDNGSEDFFFANADGDYLYARVSGVVHGTDGAFVFEYQICRQNPQIKK